MEKKAEMSGKARATGKGRPTFLVACGVCGLVAFVQLILAAVAVATRVGDTRVVEKVVLSKPKVYYIPTLADRPAEDVNAEVKPRSIEEMMQRYGNTPESNAQKNKRMRDLARKKQRERALKRGFGIGIIPSGQIQSGRFPAIKNTKVEKLVEDAKKLEMNGDLVRAILKLDEAETIDSKEPAIIYRRAMIYEDMRNWERAADAYELLFELGPETGLYYEIAADKIAHGVQDSPDIVPLLLGNVVQRVSKDRLRAKIMIPIRRNTEREIEPSQVEVRIFFYDIVDNKSIEPVPQQREQNISKRWLSLPADWVSEREETIEADYVLPRLDLANVHLFGDRKYFGQVIELYYKGELMDQYASPGRLHGIHAQLQYKQMIRPDILPFDDGGDDGSLLPLLPMEPNQ